MGTQDVPKNNPLEQGHLELLNQVLDAEADQQHLLAACTDCGLNVDKHRADSQRRLELATALKRRFFPHSS